MQSTHRHKHSVILQQTAPILVYSGFHLPLGFLWILFWEIRSDTHWSYGIMLPPEATAPHFPCLSVFVLLPLLLSEGTVVDFKGTAWENGRTRLLLGQRNYRWSCLAGGRELTQPAAVLGPGVGAAAECFWVFYQSFYRETVCRIYTQNLLCLFSLSFSTRYNSKVPKHRNDIITSLKLFQK